MAVKCPKCGGEVVRLTPEVLKCKKCGASYNVKAPGAQTGSVNSAVMPKKKGGGLKWIIVILVVIIAIAAVGFFVWKKVEENSATTELTIPAEFMEGTTQKELNEKTREGHYNSAKLNSDGSVTLEITKAQQKKVLKETEKSINNGLEDMVESEEYPNFTSVEANKDFTEFTIKTKSKELDMQESLSVIAFYMYGGMYSVFNGEEVDNISVTFINDETGETIETFNSKDMGNAEGSAAQSDEQNTSDMLQTIGNWYTVEIWNKFVDFDAFRETGKDCTGSDIDIEFAYDGFLESYALKEEYNSYINSLPEEYTELKEVWGKMNEQIELIYQDLEKNGAKEGEPELKLDLLEQYSEKFYELIEE